MLPVQYKANKNAWIMATLFEEWLICWDQDLKRNILLLVDNCFAHIINVKLQHIKVVFSLGNTMSVLQPCDRTHLENVLQNCDEKKRTENH